MSTADSEGPAWNKFWLSLDHDTESQISDSHSARGPTPSHRGGLESPVHDRRRSGVNLERVDSVQPNDSASHIGDHSEHGSHLEHQENPLDQPFPFKFKAPSGRIHRIQVASSGGLIELLGAVSEKLGNEVSEVGGEPEFGQDGKLSNQGFAVSYVDDEGDVVSITSDHDLIDAVNLARRSGRDKVDLFVHDPSKPAVAATVDPQPAVQPSRRKQKVEESDSEDEDARRHRKKHSVPPPAIVPPAEVIPGVPNELLLPGAIATLAVAIVAVFTLSRLTSR
jgi:hypothetical protein